MWSTLTRQIGPAERRGRSGDGKNPQLFFSALKCPTSQILITLAVLFYKWESEMQSCHLPGMTHMVSSRAESN